MTRAWLGKTCSIAGCEKPMHKRKGWCVMHYQRWYRHGDPLISKTPLMGAPAIARFVDKITVDPATGCWPWAGALNNNGYGQFNTGGPEGLAYAHRWSYEHFVGAIPEGLTLDHLCHTHDRECPGGLACPHRRCVNPDHLEPVTQVENMRRAAQRRAAA